MLELSEPVNNPALIAALAPRAMSGRKVDPLLSAPNLTRLPIHEIAFKEGRLLMTVEPGTTLRLQLFLDERESEHLRVT